MSSIKLQIDGMTCSHCVAAVKQAIESVPGAKAEKVEIGSASVTANDPAPIDAIKLAIEDAGYFAEVA